MNFGNARSRSEKWWFLDLVFQNVKLTSEKSFSKICFRKYFSKAKFTSWKIFSKIKIDFWKTFFGSHFSHPQSILDFENDFRKQLQRKLHTLYQINVQNEKSLTSTHQDACWRSLHTTHDHASTKLPTATTTPLSLSVFCEGWKWYYEKVIGCRK